MTNLWIGQDVKRIDGINHVTGGTKYVDDIIPPGCLFVKVLRSPVAKGEVLSIDASEAEKLPGVRCVITYEDIPNPYNDQPVLAKYIRYKGEPIAAVAAVDEQTAMRAIDLIKTSIREDQAVMDPFEAMKDGAPLVRPEGNLFQFDGRDHQRVVFGDVEEGFQKADRIIEDHYYLAPVEHCPMEVNCSVVIPEPQGRLVVYAMSQSVHVTLNSIFMVLKCEPNSDKCARWAEVFRRRGITTMHDIKVVGGLVGGAFGGKYEMQLDAITCLCALITGSPVKWRWTRADEFMYSTYRGAWHMHYKDGVMNDGRIVARQVVTIRDGGAYTSNNPYACKKFSFSACGPYYIPNVLVKTYNVYTNKMWCAGMRGFAITPSTFATEVQMDKIASEMNIDPWELRFINAYRNGDSNPTRRILDSVYLTEVMQELAKRTGKDLSEKFMRLSSAPRGGENA